MLKLALITLISFSYMLKKPNVVDVPGDWLYELRCAGRYHDSTIIWSQERGDSFDGYRHKIMPGWNFYAKAIQEPSGATDICLQEAGWNPTVKSFFKDTAMEFKLKGNASVQGYDFEPVYYGMGGLSIESKGLKLSYKTDLRDHETFTADLGVKVALAFLGKGAWFMPETHYTVVNGEDDYMSKMTVGVEWR